MQSFLSAYGGDARIRTGGKGFAGLCLTTWPRRRLKKPTVKKSNRLEKSNGADDGVRTRDPNLGKVVLYQLSHVRAQESIIRKPVFRATPFLKKLFA